MTQNGHVNQDDAADRLSHLSIKRDRTLQDIDALHANVRANRRALEHFHARQADLLNGYHTALAENGTSPDVLVEWQETITSSSAEFLSLLEEWERNQTQERILVQMLIEIERQIEELSGQLS